MTPSTYRPLRPEQFIGGARTAAIQLQRAVAHAGTIGHEPLKFLCNGDPGIGKSALAAYFQHLLGCNKWSTTKYNGTQIKVEVVDDIAASLAYRSLFGDWRLLWIDEADRIPTVAQVRLLTVLDDLPAGVAILCTSNCALKDFEPRFASRFQALVGPTNASKLDAPSSQEIAGLLSLFTTDQNAINQIATFACGNVRQALLDVQGLIQSLPLAA